MLQGNVKVLRNLLGMTQDDLAEAIGSKKSYIWEIENREVNPSISIVKRLSIALNVSIDDLVNTDCSDYEVEPQKVKLKRADKDKG